MSKYTGIACNDSEAIRAQVWISDLQITQDAQYDHGAVVPNVNRWRPSREEFAPFLATPETPTGGTIELIHTTKALERYLSVNRNSELKPTDCAPNQLTTTKSDGDSLLRHGLHFDNHFQFPAVSRLTSPRRIGRNSGPGGRWLLLGSIDAIELTQLLGYPPEHIPTVHDIRRYVANLNKFGGLVMRCLWVPIPRFTAYIAPTEMIVHDGSTFTMPEPSTIRFWMTEIGRGQLGSIY